MATGPAAHQPAALDAIREIEEELGFDLPADYTAFLQRSNGFDIDVDPVVESRFRLHQIETIIDKSHGYGFDVRDQQIVVIGDDGGEHAYAIDFRFDPVQFVRVSYYDHDRRSFEYLGDSLEVFVRNVLEDTKLKKPKGLAKRKKKTELPNKVDRKRKPEDPGLALILKDHHSEVAEPAIFVKELGQFVFRGQNGSHVLDPDDGNPHPLPGEARRSYPPFAYNPPRNSLIGKVYEPEQHKWFVGEFDIESGERIGTFPDEPHVHSQLMQISPDGGSLVAAGRDFYLGLHDTEGAFGGLALFDTATRELRRRFFSWQDGTPGLTINADGLLVHVSTRREGDRAPFRSYREILFRSLETGDVVRKIELKESFPRYYWLRTTSSGRLLAVNGDHIVCEIHDDGGVTQPIGPRRLAETNSLALVGDDRLLIGTGAGSLHLLDLATGEQLWSARHRRGCCGCLCVSADNRWVLTGGLDAGPTRLWRLPD
ncbi:SMI1/KNR4 family protein [Lignipirellula cremea]|nr:SMI1/KNR4 family protein [Lignipirellula cremea]